MADDEAREQARENAKRFLEQHLQDMAELKLKVDATMRMVHDMGDRLFNRGATAMPTITKEQVREAAKVAKQAVSTLMDVLSIFKPR